MSKLPLFAAMIAVLLVSIPAFALSESEKALLIKAGVPAERIMQLEQEGVAVPPDNEAQMSKTSPAAPPFDFTDWDGDGKKDIVAGTNNGELNVYINTGTNASPRFEDRMCVQDGEVDSGTISVPCIVDWDNDGVKDLLMGSRGGEVTLFLNRGTNQSPAFGPGSVLQGGEVDPGSYSAPTVADYNNDGRKDLILGNFNGEILVYVNIGEDASPRFGEDPVELDVKVPGYSTPFAARNYNSGGFDILCGSADGRVYRLTGGGSSTQPVFSAPRDILVNDRPFILPGNTNVISTDWDGDGREDLLVSNRMTEQTRGTSSVSPVTSGSGSRRARSKVYMLKNYGSDEEPRYNDAVEILSDYVDINL